MSNLKHKTDDELRSLIAWCKRKREDLLADAARKEAEAEALVAEAARLRHDQHNIGQKEVWARYYLAQRNSKVFVR